VDARNDVLLDRIRRRNRPYETSIDAAYLEALRNAYTRHHNTVGKLQVLSFDTSELNLRSETQVGSLFKKILAAACLH